MGALPPSKETEVSSNHKSIAVSDQGQSGHCYAHAIATAIIETEYRIIGRIPSNHTTLKDTIVEWHELDHEEGEGANDYEMTQILDMLYEEKRVIYQPIVEFNCKQNIRRAVDKGHVVIATYQLSNGGWANFFSFFLEQPKDWVIEKSDIDKAISHFKNIDDSALSKKKQKKNGGGHAVVITGYGFDKKYGIYWQIKNSWGQKHADNGYFRVMPNALVFTMYLDVYHSGSDLTEMDKANRRQLQVWVDKYNRTRTSDMEYMTLEKVNKLCHYDFESCIVL
eukprot:343798_1